MAVNIQIISSGLYHCTQWFYVDTCVADEHRAALFEQRKAVYPSKMLVSPCKAKQCYKDHKFISAITVSAW
jgi:hypothetical protein